MLASTRGSLLPVGEAHVVGGITVVRKYDSQAAVPERVVKAEARTADSRQFSRDSVDRRTGPCSPRRQLSALQTDNVVLVVVVRLLAATKAGIESMPARPRNVNRYIFSQKNTTGRRHFGDGSEGAEAPSCNLIYRPYWNTGHFSVEGWRDGLLTDYSMGAECLRLAMPMAELKEKRPSQLNERGSNY